PPGLGKPIQYPGLEIGTNGLFTEFVFGHQSSPRITNECEFVHAIKIVLVDMVTRNIFRGSQVCQTGRPYRWVVICPTQKTVSFSPRRAHIIKKAVLYALPCALGNMHKNTSYRTY